MNGKKWPIHKKFLYIQKILLDNICKLAFQSLLLVKARVNKKKGLQESKSKNKILCWMMMSQGANYMLKTIRISTNPTVWICICVCVLIVTQTADDKIKYVMHNWQTTTNKREEGVRERKRKEEEKNPNHHFVHHANQNGILFNLNRKICVNTCLVSAL